MSEQRGIDLIDYETAAAILGIMPRTLRKRILEDQLTRYVSPIDRRARFLDRDEVEALLKFTVYQPRERAA